MRILHGGAVLVTAAMLLSSAACGSSGGKAGATPSGSNASGGFAAYADCLHKHGVTIPTTPPSGAPPGGRRFFAGAAGQQARQACRSLAPQRQGRGMQQAQAFRRCMSDHGVRLPTPAPGAVRSPGARRTPGDRLLGRFDTADPKTAKALRICRPLLPSFTPRPSAT